MLSRNSLNLGMVKPWSEECSAFGGAIFLCSHLTRKECFERKLFGLSPNCADFVERIKTGTTLFLYDVDQHNLHGVFEATSDGALDIIPDAYISTGQRYPSQIRFKRVWFCKPLMEDEFRDAIQNNFAVKNKFSYVLSRQQVAKLLHLFSSRNRLQPQNPRLQDDISGEVEISSLVKNTNMQSSPNSSSCSSFISPSQTCSSSTRGEHAASLGHKSIDRVSLVHRVQQSDTSDLVKSNSSKSPLCSGADTTIVTIPIDQDAMNDQSTDDYIPLPPEEDVLEGFDDLFGFLEDESHSSESKGSSDSEDTNFHQACVGKEDVCYAPKADSKLRSDTEGRKSVFSRLVRTHKTSSRRTKSKTKSFPPWNVAAFNPLRQRAKHWRAQRNKPVQYPNEGMLDMCSAGRSSRAPPLDYSFVWDNSKKRNTWRKPFVPIGSANIPPVLAGVHMSSEVGVNEEMKTPSVNLKRYTNNSNIEGGNQDFVSEDVEEAGRKKRVAMASFHQDCPSGTSSVPKGTKAIDMLAISDGNNKEKNTNMPSKDTYTPYLETKMVVQDEQEQNIPGCFEYGENVTNDMSLALGGSKTTDLLTKQSFEDSRTNEETGILVGAGRVGTETSFQEKQNQSLRSCHRVVNEDKILLPGKFETTGFLLNHDKDCGNRRDLPSESFVVCHPETEIPLMQKPNLNVQRYSEVVRDDKDLVPEIFELPNFDADCGYKGTNLGSDCREEVRDLVRNYHEIAPCDAAPVLESSGPSNFPRLHGDSADKNSLLDETSEHVSAGHQDTVMLPQDEHCHSSCGDTSSVLEYSTVDTSTGDGASENKNSLDQKDDEIMYSSEGSRSCAPTDDQDRSKVLLPKEEQYQNFQHRPELVHESSNSMDSFAVSAEGCGSKSGISAEKTSGTQVTDLLGTNSESRTGSVNDSSSGSAETFSIPALGSLNNEVYTEPPLLQHDPGEAMEPLWSASAITSCRL